MKHLFYHKILCYNTLSSNINCSFLWNKYFERDPYFTFFPQEFYLNQSCKLLREIYLVPRVLPCTRFRDGKFRPTIFIAGWLDVITNFVIKIIWTVCFYCHYPLSFFRFHKLCVFRIHCNPFCPTCFFNLFNYLYPESCNTVFFL